MGWRNFSRRVTTSRIGGAENGTRDPEGGGQGVLALPGLIVVYRKQLMPIMMPAASGTGALPRVLATITVLPEAEGPKSFERSISMTSFSPWRRISMFCICRLRYRAGLGASIIRGASRMRDLRRKGRVWMAAAALAGVMAGSFERSSRRIRGSCRSVLAGPPQRENGCGGVDSARAVFSGGRFVNERSEATMFLALGAPRVKSD